MWRRAGLTLILFLATSEEPRSQLWSSIFLQGFLFRFFWSVLLQYLGFGGIREQDHGRDGITRSRHTDKG